MDNKHQEEYIAYSIIFGLLIVFSVFILNQYFYTSEKRLDIINAAILFWTGVVIAIYTGVTYKLWTESQRQTELQLRPFVFVIVEAEPKSDAASGSSGSCITYVENLGNGTAVNVSVTQVKESATQSIYDFPESVPLLTARQRRPIRCYPGHKEGVGDASSPEVYSLCNLSPRDNQEPVVLRIEFKNIEGHGYTVTQTISRNNLDFDFA